MKSIFIIIVYLASTLFLYTCERDRTTLSYHNKNSNNDSTVLIYSFQDSIEAREFATWYSGELLPSDSLVFKLLYNLNYLRSVYGDSFSVLDTWNRFLAPWVIGQLVVRFDSTTASLINNNEYTGWDSIEVTLRPDSVLKYPDRFGIALFGFDEYYNPRRLAEIYETLPGVIWAEPNGIDFDGLSGFPFFPGVSNNELTYLYPFLPGITHYYLYFKFIGGEPQHIGTWDIINEPEPPWWQEAKKNIDWFNDWDGP